jgi:hypothetical protein
MKIALVWDEDGEELKDAAKVSLAEFGVDVVECNHDVRLFVTMGCPVFAFSKHGHDFSCAASHLGLIAHTVYSHKGAVISAKAGCEFFSFPTECIGKMGVDNNIHFIIRSMIDNGLN